MQRVDYTVVDLTTRRGEVKESGVTAVMEVRRWAAEPESRMSKSIFPTGKVSRCSFSPSACMSTYRGDLPCLMDSADLGG